MRKAEEWNTLQAYVFPEKYLLNLFEARVMRDLKFKTANDPNNFRPIVILLNSFCKKLNIYDDN